MQHLPVSFTPGPLPLAGEASFKSRSRDFHVKGGLT
jgi:hypothetical protein